MAAEPFTIAIADEAIADLQDRLQRTRWPTEFRPEAGWQYGTNQAYLKQLCGYWLDGYDWRAQESHLNRLDHFKREVDGFNLHYIHAKGKGPNPLPLVITHGWPSTFYDFDKIIDMLSDPGAHGGNPADSFDVVIPSMPGYAFSEKPSVPGYAPTRVAELWDRLMVDLGYEHYGAYGGDWGSTVTSVIGRNHADNVIGILRLVGSIPRVEQKPGERLADGGGYGHIQSTRPLTVAYGLTDSPVGLAGWILEKWQAWSDCGDNIESRFSKDELLTTIALYWFTETAYSSARLYYENARNNIADTDPRPIEIPTGYAVCRWLRQTREELAQQSNLVHWTEFNKGAHFMAGEEPELLARDIRKFFRPLR